MNSFLEGRGSIIRDRGSVYGGLESIAGGLEYPTASNRPEDGGAHDELDNGTGAAPEQVEGFR